MHKFIEIVVFILAIVGLTCIVKHIMHCEEGCCLCGWQKTKVEDQRPAGETVSYKIRVE
jgi:hypothetical protein